MCFLQPVRILLLRDHRRQKEAKGSELTINEAMSRFMTFLSREFKIPILGSSAELQKLTKGHSQVGCDVNMFRYRGYLLETSASYDNCCALFGDRTGSKGKIFMRLCSKGEEQSVSAKIRPTPGASVLPTRISQKS